MRGGAIFLVFLALFTAASYAVPVPLFPGNLVPSLGFVSVPSPYAPFFSAFVNGVVYGFVVWLVFVLVSRKFEEPKVADIRRKGQGQRNKKKS